MKKTFILSFFVLVLAFGIFSACSSVVPLSSDVSFPGDSGKYAILGRVTLEDKAGKNSYTKLIQKAKQMYPEADDVVNIVVDAKETNFFGMKSYKYILSGIAIDYKEVE
ncbi:MAG: hypothetical protein ACTTKL_02770 [Treponema sp.]